jgi:c-di-GMP-binding flagellar brake protein YcgR
MRTLLQKPFYSRRKTLRVDTPEGVRVYWSSAGRNDVLRVRNLSFGGVFIDTHEPQSVGAKAQIDFLVEEGQIRTKAVVRHVEGANGMGLEFTAVAQEDRPHLATLLTRLRGLSRSRPNLHE